MPGGKDWDVVDREAQEESAQDYLRLKTDVEDRTTLTGKRLRENPE